jgi:putative protease
LAPAGDTDCVRAAVENGADAIYFGLDAGFNARARATNISLATLDDLMATLHRRRVKGYVTLNTLVFSSELAGVEQIVRRVAAAGVDAVLVQDVGLARMIHALAPRLAIHASTQMTLTSSETIRVARSLGVERVVLARELSLDEIKKIAAETTMPLEVFVHGALCVAYSGQCMTSESLGGRSANRGQCAQACRLPYELVCDGEHVDLGDQRYLLSPQDLAAYDLVPELIAAGVCSFKIEGRLKTPEYVANITRHYREAIDTALAGHPVELTPRDVEEMELSFSRGFSHGWLDGCDHKLLVPATSSAKRGVLLGQVRAISRDRVTVELSRGVHRGDGVVFAGDRAENEEQGGRVYEIFSAGRAVDESAAGQVAELAFGRDAIDLSRLRPGQPLWKTDDPQLTRRLRRTFETDKPRRRTRVDLALTAAVGEPLAVTATIDGQPICRVSSSEPLAEARKHPVTLEVLAEQFGRLGGTPYQLGRCEARITGAPMAPLSVLAKMRHELVRQLDEGAARATPDFPERSVLDALRAGIRQQASAVPARPLEEDAPTLHVLSRSLEVLDAVLAYGVGSVLADFADIRQYGIAVERAHAAGATVAIATPRIQKPDEMGILRAMLRHGADNILVRHFAALAFYAEQGLGVIADFSLNATNELSVDWLRRAGARRVTASYDLNRDQLLDLVNAVPAAWLEVVIHQHMPMFHMEHCVFCSVLSPGTNKHNCGRPCDTHQVRLRDRIGKEHPLTADVGCRNTLFNATPQSAAELVPQLLARGLRDFRIEFGPETLAHDVPRTLELYRRLLASELSGKEVWSALVADNRVGVTRGSLEARRNPLAIL